MGFTLSRNCNFSSSISALPSPEVAAQRRANHQHMENLWNDPPITEGSEKQLIWAKRIAQGFLFHAHSWGFAAIDIDLLFANQGKYARFWIDNRNPHGNSGEGFTRMGVTKAIAELKADRAAYEKAEAELKKLTQAELAAKVRRF